MLQLTPNHPKIKSKLHLLVLIPSSSQSQGKPGHVPKAESNKMCFPGRENCCEWEPTKTGKAGNILYWLVVVVYLEQGIELQELSQRGEEILGTARMVKRPWQDPAEEGRSCLTRKHCVNRHQQYTTANHMTLAKAEDFVV